MKKSCYKKKTKRINAFKIKKNLDQILDSFYIYKFYFIPIFVLLSTKEYEKLIKLFINN